jgi:hypothetical protein
VCSEDFVLNAEVDPVFKSDLGRTRDWRMIRIGHGQGPRFGFTR